MGVGAGEGNQEELLLAWLSVQSLYLAQAEGGRKDMEPGERETSLVNVVGGGSRS